MIDNTNGSAQAVIRINQLHLRNFKGIERFDLVIDGEDVTIRGDNATGKTTLADAISWLLFGKDSTGRADFEIKTLKATGDAIHNLEHEVEAEITGGGATTMR